MGRVRVGLGLDGIQLLLLEELLCQVLEVALLEGDAGFYKKP